MVLRLLLVSLLFFLHTQIQGQRFDEKYFVYYGVQQGLSDNYVSGIAQDSAGYIWISTRHGLNRFDGSQFKHFFNDGSKNSLADNSIFSMGCYKKNELLLATDNGAQVISTVSLKSKNLDFPTPGGLRYWSHACKYISADQSGNYGVSTKTGFYIFSNNGRLIKRFDKFNENDIGHAWMNYGAFLSQLPDGNLMQRNSDGLKIFDRLKNEFAEIPSSYRGLALINSELKNMDYYFMNREELLGINFKTNNFELISIYSGEKKSFPAGFSLKEEIGWQTKLVRLNDSLWVLNAMSTGFYVIHIDAQKKTVRVTGQKYFKGHACISLFTDKNGNLWVGTSKGLFMEKKGSGIIRSFTVAGTGTASSFAVTSLYISHDKIFAGTDKEELLVLNRQTKQLIKNIRLNRIYSNPAWPVCFLSVHPDTLWVMTFSGLIWVHTGNFTSGPVFTTASPVISGSSVLFADSKKNIWIGTESVNRIYRYNRERNELLEINSHNNPLYKINLANHIAEDRQGNIWLGGDAIARWNSKTGKIDTLVEHLPTQKNQKKGYAVFNDFNGDVWALLNDDGLAKLTGEGLPIHIRPPNFLQDKSVFVFPTALNNKIFIATSTGVGLFNFANQKVVMFSENDGLTGNEDISTIKFSADTAEQSIWFAKQNTIYEIPGRINNIYMPSPALSITELAVLKDEVYNYPQGKILLKYFQNDIKISLSAPNFNDPGNMRFAYRFRNGDDTSWIDIGTQQSILLTNISPGTYKLQVKVNAYDNKWPESITEIQIVVKPPFWKTAWFFAAVALLIAGAAYFLYANRIKQINQRANLDKLLAHTEMKALHTQMNPHFIFNCLNSIKKMILDNENGNASRYLSKFAQLIRITLNQSSKSFISLHSTIDYLERYLEMEQVRTNKFNYKIETGNELYPEDVYLPPMLIQPLIENAIWHGSLPEDEIMQIDIRFKKQGNKLVCTVEDNGIGIEASLKKKEDTITHHSLGIANIRQRIQVLNEKYNLHSTLNIEDKAALKTGQGTIATLLLPVKNTDT